MVGCGEEWGIMENLHNIGNDTHVFILYWGGKIIMYIHSVEYKFLPAFYTTKPFSCILQPVKKDEKSEKKA